MERHTLVMITRLHGRLGQTDMRSTRRLFGPAVNLELHIFSLASIDFTFAWKNLSCVFGLPLCGQHKGFLGWDVVTGSVQFA